MIISWIWTGLAGGLLASTLYYRKKWKDTCEQKELSDRLYSDCDNQRHKLLVLSVHGHKHLMVKDYPSKHSWINSYVAVIGTINHIPDNSFIVKEFYYDKNDPSDREFAIREAEELIETIQKA